MTDVVRNAKDDAFAEAENLAFAEEPLELPATMQAAIV
jgi:hypothetical protein